MFSTLRRKTGAALDRLWVRIAFVAVLSVVAILVALIARPFLPEEIAETVGTDALDDLLTIIASSMLAVVTFSLAVMVSIYRSASAQWTPRIHRLMLEDRTTQNTLATFVGAYIYALTSIVLLRTTVFGDGQDDDPQVILFFFTIIVLILIVVSIVRWILHLQRVGSLIDVARRIEHRTKQAFESRMNTPCLGGHPLQGPDDIPSDAFAVTSEESGYVQLMYQGAISDAADEHDVDVYLHVPVGHFLHRGQALCHLSTENDEMVDSVRTNIVIGDLRTFDQDPRFGLIVLGEVGSKAMSSGINDPGTAIDVIGRMARILQSYRSEMDAASDDMSHPRLWVPPLAAADLIEDGFDPIARDGGGTVEVQLALQKALAALAHHPAEVLAQAARESAVRAFRRSERQLDDDHDLERLRRATPAHAQSPS